MFEAEHVYFAVDRSDIAALVQALQLRFQQADQLISPDSAAQWFGLVDGAFDHGTRPLTWHLPTTPIYKTDSPNEGLVQVSPYLVVLPAPGEAEFERHMRQLLRHCSGRPMLSFVASNLDAEALCAQWQRCLTLQMPDDNKPYLVRFADTRVAPALASLPGQQLWLAMTQAVSQWLVVDRTAALLHLPINTVEVAAKTAEASDAPIELTHEDLSHLLKCGQADSVINVIEDQLPELLPEQQRSQFHSQVVLSCALAERYAVVSFPDVVALAVAIHLTKGQILNDAALVTLLAEKRWATGQLNDALVEFLPEVIQ